MTSFVALTVVAAMSASAGEGLESASAVAKVVQGPDFELLGVDGERYHLYDARGKVLLVNFWATWCASCRSEIAEINALYTELKDLGLEVYGISTDAEGAEKVLPYMEEQAMDYPVLLDPKAKSTVIFGGLEGYPMTFIFDREGLIYSSYLGAQDGETFRADIEYLLAADTSSAAPLTIGERD